MKINNFLSITFLAALTGSFIGLTGCSTDAELGAGSEVQNSALGFGKKMPAGSFFCDIRQPISSPIGLEWRYEVRYSKNPSPNPMPSNVDIIVFKNGKKITTVNAPSISSYETGILYRKELSGNRYVRVEIYKFKESLFKEVIRAVVVHEIENTVLVALEGNCTKT